MTKGILRMTDSEILQLFEEDFVRIPEMVMRNWALESEKLRPLRIEEELMRTFFDGRYIEWIPKEAREDLRGKLRNRNTIEDLFSTRSARKVPGMFADAEHFDYEIDFYRKTVWYRRGADGFRTLTSLQLLELYACIADLPVKKAVEKAAKEFNIGRPPYFASDPDDMKWNCRRTHKIFSARDDEYLFTNDDRKQVAVVTKYEKEEEKYFLPRSHWKPPKFGVIERVAFPVPAPLYRPLQHHFLKEHIPKTVLLTDSLEIAQKNSFHLWQQIQTCDRPFEEAYEMLFTHEWISWYGDCAGVAHADWSPLRGRQVYYLLIEHSGLGAQEVYETGRAVQEELKKVGVEELKFISFLYTEFLARTQSGFIRAVPTILTDDEFFTFGRYAPPNKRLLSLFSNPEQHRLLQLNQSFLLRPFLRAQSVTLLYGERQSGKTWLTLSAAYATSQGLTPEEMWDTKESANVLYIHEERDGKFSLGEKLPVILRMQLSHYGNALADFSMPNVGSVDPLPFPRLNNKPEGTVDNVKLDRFHWISKENVFDFGKDQYAAACNILGLADQGNYKLIVLDGIPLLEELISSRPSERYVNILTSLCISLKQKNCAVILIPPTSLKGKNIVERSRSFPFDNVVEVERAISPIATNIGILFIAHKLAGYAKQIEKPIALWELDFSPQADIPVWTFMAEDLSLKRKRWYTKKLHEEGLDWKQVARFLCFRVYGNFDAQQEHEMHQCVRQWAKKMELTKERNKPASGEQVLNLLRETHQDPIVRALNLLEKMMPVEEIVKKIDVDQGEYVRKKSELFDGRSHDVELHNFPGPIPSCPNRSS